VKGSLYVHILKSKISINFELLEGYRSLLVSVLVLKKLNFLFPIKTKYYHQKLFCPSPPNFRSFEKRSFFILQPGILEETSVPGFFVFFSDDD